MVLTTCIWLSPPPKGGGVFEDVRLTLYEIDKEQKFAQPFK